MHMLRTQEYMQIKSLHADYSVRLNLVPVHQRQNGCDVDWGVFAKAFTIIIQTVAFMYLSDPTTVQFDMYISKMCSYLSKCSVGPFPHVQYFNPKAGTGCPPTGFLPTVPKRFLVG